MFLGTLTSHEAGSLAARSGDGLDAVRSGLHAVLGGSDAALRGPHGGVLHAGFGGLESALGGLESTLGGLGTSQGAVEVDINLTTVGQMVLFVVLWLVLKPVLFDPMLKLFEEREKRIDGAKLRARGIDQESLEAERKYEAAIAKVRADAAVERDRLRGEGAKAEADLLSKVRVETAKVLDEGRARITADATAARTALLREAPVLAIDMAHKALGREVSS